MNKYLKVYETATPTSSSSTTSSSNSTSTSTSSTSVPSTSCPTIDTGVVPPVITETRRVSPTSVFINWGPFSGTDKFNVRYGPSDGKWLYNTDVSGFSTTINDLPAGSGFWVQIAARNDCQIGSYGSSKYIGGTAPSNIGVPGFPNTGNPGLPKTGFDPKENYTGITVLSLFVIILISIVKRSKKI